MTNRNTSKFALIGLVAVSLVAVALMAGSGAAVVTTDETNFTAVGNDTLSNQEFAVDNDTRSLYVDLDNSTYNATSPVNVTVIGVADDGTETQVSKVQISAAADSVESYEYTGVDSSTYSTYRLEVVGTGTDIESQALDVGTVQKTSGGGGLLGGGSIGGIPIIALVLIGGGYFLVRE